MADVYELNTIADLLKIPVKSLDACLRDLRYALELCHFAGGEDTSTMAFDSFAWTDDGRHDIDMSMNGEPFLKLNVTDEAALSHAAGQEAVAFRFVADGDAYNPFKPEWFDGVPEPHDIENAKRFPGVRIEYAYLHPDVARNDAAPPTTSAEVGQDGEQCRAASVAFGDVTLAVIQAACDEYARVGMEQAGESEYFADAMEAAIKAALRALSRGVPEGKDGERYRYLCERHPLKMQRWLVGEVAEGKIDRKDLIDAAVDEQMARDYAAIAAQRKEGA